MPPLADPALFAPRNIGAATIKNRIVRSATYESLANVDGTLNEEYAELYSRLGQGEIGLIITGVIGVVEGDKSFLRQASLGSDRNRDAFGAMNERARRGGAKIFAQLGQGGRQTHFGGRRPRAVSPGPWDPVFRVRPAAMDAKEIAGVIEAFGAAARRAREAGFDGVQIHAAHGYLLSGFLSPRFNRRKDEWGGGPENRFRLLRKVYEAIRESVGTGFPVTAKINVSDDSPGDIAPDDIAYYAQELAGMSIDAVEISCGTVAFTPVGQSRGGVPVKEFSGTMPTLARPLGRLMLRAMYPERRFAFEEGYNLWAAERVKAALGDTPLIVVGGLRRPEFMDGLVRSGAADFVALSRPFVREPQIARKWKEGEMRAPSCESCNRCFAMVARDLPLRCYWGAAPSGEG